jgi:hypothetical protein
VKAIATKALPRLYSGYGSEALSSLPMLTIHDCSLPTI